MITIEDFQKVEKNPSLTPSMWEKARLKFFPNSLFFAGW